MNTILLKSNSKADLDLIIALAKKLGIKTENLNDNYKNDSNFLKVENNSNHNFFDSVGLWKNRNIDAKTLRQESWQIQD